MLTPIRSKKSHGTPTTGRNMSSSASLPLKRRKLKRAFAAVTVDRGMWLLPGRTILLTWSTVRSISFTDAQKKWLRENATQNFKPPSGVSGLEQQAFYRGVWDNFNVAFPHNNITESEAWSVQPGDLFERYLWGRVSLCISVQFFGS